MSQPFLGSILGCFPEPIPYKAFRILMPAKSLSLLVGNFFVTPWGILYWKKSCGLEKKLWFGYFLLVATNS
jgi:hypothetical protein